MELQLTKERLFERGARTMPADKVLIVCDRGAMDNKAYMTEAEFSRLCAELHTSEAALRDRYDAVFHLVTAAKGAEEAYTFANNAARYETVEQAVALDARIAAAWSGHAHLRIIDNSTAFEEKLERLLHEILSFLGEPVPLEVERTFLIRYPDVAWLESLEGCRRVEITQTYLLSGPDEEVRVRQQGADGTYFYYETVNKPLDGTQRVEAPSHPEGVHAAARGRGPRQADPAQDPLPAHVPGAASGDRPVPLLVPHGPLRDRAFRRAHARPPAASAAAYPGGHRRSRLPQRRPGNGEPPGRVKANPRTLF